MAIVLPKFPRRRASTARQADSRPTLSVRCCREDGLYAAGDLLRCTWQVNRLADNSPQGLELSVLWYTEGKGDEDLTVHYFHRWSASRLLELDLDQPQHFETRLPESPTTYNGHLFRIRWCARMRLFLSGGGVNGAGIVVQQPFTVISSLQAEGNTQETVANSSDLANSSERRHPSTLSTR